MTCPGPFIKFILQLQLQLQFRNTSILKYAKSQKDASAPSGEKGMGAKDDCGAWKSPCLLQ